MGVDRWPPPLLVLTDPVGIHEPHWLHVISCSGLQLLTSVFLTYPGVRGSLSALPPPASLTSLAVSATPTPSWAFNPAPTLGTLPAPSPLASSTVPSHQHHPFNDTLPPTPFLSSQSSPGMILSPACDPFPESLVRRIQSGQFVDMRDLLADNIALISQLSSLHGPGALPLSSVGHTRLREVPSLVSWLYCFIAYVAIRTLDPLTRQMLAYSRLIIREALRHGGSGWVEYDRVFRRQLSINPSLAWNALEPSLQAATILGQRSSGGTLCNLCQESDHPTNQCALAPLQQQLHPSPTPTASHTAAAYRPPMRTETLQRICVAWNKGTCFRPHCTFRHTCATCQRNHKARDCPNTPPHSEYKVAARSPLNPRT